MRCRNPKCRVKNGRIIRDPSDKTRETGICGFCRIIIRQEKEKRINYLSNQLGVLDRNIILENSFTKT